MQVNPSNINQDASKEDMVNVICRHEIFSDLSPDEAQQLNAIVSYRAVKKMATIFEIDDAPDHIFYLLEGALTLNFPDNSKLHILPDELIGEIGILNGDYRLGRLVADEDSDLIAICTRNMFDPEIVKPALSLKIVKRLSKRVTNYLRSIQHISSKELILEGESDSIEFKSSLRWNLKAERKDDRVTNAVLKTIAAFLNSEGGTLFVGVADNGEIVGLKHDLFENDDRLLLFLTDVIKSRMGTLHLDHIHYHTERIQNKTILRVDVQASNIPCYFIGDKYDHFYIRTGPSTTDLKLREVCSFIKERFD